MLLKSGMHEPTLRRPTDEQKAVAVSDELFCVGIRMFLEADGFRLLPGERLVGLGVVACLLDAPFIRLDPAMPSDPVETLLLAFKLDFCEFTLALEFLFDCESCKELCLFAWSPVSNGGRRSLILEGDRLRPFDLIFVSFELTVLK